LGPGLLCPGPFSLLIVLIHPDAERDCPKSPERLRTEASKTDEPGPRSTISLLETTKIEASDATLTPFRTVSEGKFSETCTAPVLLPQVPRDRTPANFRIVLCRRPYPVGGPIPLGPGESSINRGAESDGFSETQDIRRAEAVRPRPEMSPASL
jgi:hypothetical protein